MDSLSNLAVSPVQTPLPVYFVLAALLFPLVCRILLLPFYRPAEGRRKRGHPHQTKKKGATNGTLDSPTALGAPDARRDARRRALARGRTPPRIRYRHPLRRGQRT